MGTANVIGELLDPPIHMCSLQAEDGESKAKQAERRQKERQEQDTRRQI